LKLATIARQKVKVFNSSLDVRYSRDHIVSHDKNKIPSKAVPHARDILKFVGPDISVIGIDEVQFFDPEVIPVCEELARAGKRVIVAGLDQDYKGQAFEITAKLLALSEFVTKNLAIGVACGTPANKSQRLSHSRKRIDVGASAKYAPRCRRCFKPE